MHINYCEQGQTLVETCQKAVKWGFDGVEFRRDRTKRITIEETHDQYFDKLEKAVSESGLQKVLFGSLGPNYMQENADARKRETESYIKFLEDAKARFGSTTFNARSGRLINPDVPSDFANRDKHGSGAASDKHFEWATEGFKEIAPYAESEGLTLAFETHFGFIHDLPEPAKRLVDAIDSPAIGINFDYGNMMTFPEPPDLTESIEIMGDKILYLHLKSLYRLPEGGYVMTSLAEGQINNRAMLRQVFAPGYDGAICIEAPRQGDREQFAQEDLAYLKALLLDLD